jgi:hypothetical protein
LDTSVDFADDIVKGCCVLHNSVRDGDGFQLEDTLSVVGFENTVGSRANVQRIRDTFADYFVSNIGQVPWQKTVIGKKQFTEH